jgi:adenosylcobinamide-phosphate synthase
LGLALAGPRRYAEHVVEDPFLNAEATSNAVPDDIGRALDLYAGACVIEGAIYAALALVV